MSRLNCSMRRRATVGLLVVAGSIAVAGTARAATASAHPAGPSQVALSLDLPVITPHDGPVDSLQCLLFAYNLGPFGPMGPWGPMGPLHDKPHPACFGGGPEFK